MPLLPRKRKYRFLLFLGGLLFLILLVDQILVFSSRRLTISPETTRLTSPILNGHPDYLAALNTHYNGGVTRENNAAVLLLQLYDLNDTPAIWRAAVYKTLEI